MKKVVLEALRALFSPPPKRDWCPHCGGTRCFGMCSVANEKTGRTVGTGTRSTSAGQCGESPPRSSSGS